MPGYLSKRRYHRPKACRLPNRNALTCSLRRASARLQLRLLSEMSVCFGGDKLLERRSALLENVSLVTVNAYALDHDERFFLQIESGTIRIGSLPGGKGAFHVMRICRLAAVPRYALAMPSRMVEARLILATIAQRYRL